MTKEELLERLEWLATAPRGSAPPEWLGDNEWDSGIRAVAQAALDDIKAAHLKALSTKEWAKPRDDVQSNG